MLSKTDIANTHLAAVKPTNARVIPIKKEEEEKTVPDKAKKEKVLHPPLSQFNTGYIKAKDNDPL